MNFIHVFDKELKNKLIQNGFNLVSELNNLYIFENSKCVKFNFSEIDKKQFIFTNKMAF